MYMFNKQRLKNIAVKHQRRTEAAFMLKWLSRLVELRKLKRLGQILQDQIDSRLVHKFLPQLTQNCFYLKVGDHIQLKRLREIQQEFIT